MSAPSRKPASEFSTNQNPLTRFQRFVELSSDNFILSDARGKVLYSNQAIKSLLGYSVKEFTELNARDLVHPDDMPKARAFLRRLIENPASTQKQVLRLQHKKGHYRWLELHATNLLDDEAVQAIMYQSWDVTAAVEMEASLALQKARQLKKLERDVADQSRELRQTSDELDRIFEHSFDAIAYINDQFYLQKANKAFTELFGIEKSKLGGRDVFSLFLPEKREELMAILKEIVTNHAGREIESICLQNDGKDFEAAVSITYVPANVDFSFSLVFTIRSISERKAQERLLRYHASLQANLSDAVIVTDMDFRIQSWNRAAEYIYGWRSEEVIGKTIAEVLATDFDLPFDQQRYLDDLRERGWARGEFRQRRKNGEYFYVWASVTLIRDEFGQPSSVVAINRDINERKAIEDALSTKLAEELTFQTYLKELHQITIELTHISDLDTFYRRAVELGRERFGFERMGFLLYDKASNEVIGTYGTDEFGHVVDEHHLRFSPDSFTGILARSIKGQSLLLFDEHSELFANGRSLGYGWKAVALLTIGEERLGWLTVDNGLVRLPISQPILDILALYGLSIGTLLGKKRADAALRESEASLRLLLEGAAHAIIISNLENKIIYLNAKAESLLDYERENLMGQSLELIIPELDPSLPSNLLDGNSHSPTKNKVETFVRRRDASLFWAELEFSSIQSRTSRLTMTFIEDISPRKQAQAEMQQNLDKERELNELKSRFITIASHEFRTPLAVMKTSVDLVMRYGEKQGLEWSREKLGKISDQIWHMNSILNDVLSLERLQSPEPGFKPTMSDIGSLCHEIIAEFKSRTALQHELRCNVPENLPPIFFDRDLMWQVISNILSNAIKYSSPDKPVTLKIETKSKDIVLSVQDEGLGIPKADIEQLFRPFHRAANVADIPGTGLGLAISKLIVELHKGSLKVQSKVGKGTKMIVTLPRPE